MYDTILHFQVSLSEFGNTIHIDVVIHTLRSLGIAEHHGHVGTCIEVVTGLLVTGNL